MRPIHTIAALILVTGSGACTEAQDKNAETTSSTSPMAEYARMVGGEWMMTAQSGTSMCDTWHWGPGKHSMRVMTDGESADGSPWRALQVVYWHPVHEQIHVLSMHPDIPGIGRGVGEGHMEFAGDTVIAFFELFQPRGPRKLTTSWVFDGPDRYHAALGEAAAGGPYMTLAEWDYSRVSTNTTKRAVIPTDALKLPEELTGFEPLVGGTWNASSTDVSGDSIHIETSIEYVAVAEYIYLHSVTGTDANATRYELDAYIFHHVGTNALTCLALSNLGGVHEGSVAILEDGAIQMEWKAIEGTQRREQIARFELESGSTLRQRIWSLDGSEGTLILDVRHNRLDSAKE